MVVGEAVTLKCNFKTDGRLREIVWYRVSTPVNTLNAEDLRMFLPNLMLCCGISLELCCDRTIATETHRTALPQGFEKEMAVLNSIGNNLHQAENMLLSLK